MEVFEAKMSDWNNEKAVINRSIEVNIDNIKTVSAEISIIQLHYQAII